MELIEGRTLSIDSLLQLDGPPLPCGWEKCLDLKSGVVYFRNRVSGARSYANPLRFSLQVLEHRQPLEDGRKHGLDLELALGRRMTSTAAADRATARKHDCPVLLESSKRHRLVSEEKHGLDLRLRLQTPEQRNCPKPTPVLSLPTTASSSSCSSSSPSSSTTQVDEVETSEGESKKRRTTSSTQVMVTVGCRNCLTYVMLSKEHPCCPRCGNTLLLAFAS